MSGSKLVELIRQQTRAMMPRGIELATVVQADPLIIRVDNMPVNLEGDDLIVCEHLLAQTEPGGNDSHTHKIISLSLGDRVAVQALPGGQQYLVIDKVVVMGG